MRHKLQTLFLIIFVCLTGSGIASAQSGDCTTDPNATGAPGSFIYNGGGTTDPEGNVTCFDASSGTWKTVTTEYGQFQVQTLADQWPDGDVIAQPDGTEYRSMAVYEGFRRVVTNDAVKFSALDPISRIARHSAPAVVEVFGDRCLQYIPASYGVPASGTWDIGVKPFSGFFVNSSTIVTAAGVSNKIAFDPEAGSWGAGGYGQSQQSCSELEAMGPTTTSWEQGAGPFVRLFDGRWASGSIVASNDNVAVVRLERVTSDGDTLVSTWAPWNPALAPGDALPFSPSGAVPDSVLAIHHPEESRFSGGWHLTTGPVVACDALSVQDQPIEVGLSFAVDLYSDPGSIGAPVLDDQGFVVGMIDPTGAVGVHPDVCKEDIYRGKNTLGILSDFLADPAQMTRVLRLDQFRTLVLGVATGTSLSPAKTEPVWPLNAETIANAKFETVDWGTEFTTSGFPKSALHSDAFDVARQATLMFTREVGCAACEEAARANDFSGGCLCTGFAITNNLIITNDHCVLTMAVGDEATFRTYAGQEVGAVLVGKSSLDGVSTDVNGREYDSGHKGDVALLRTSQRMDLTPVRLADSDRLRQYDPVLSVGHPQVMLSSGPFVTVAGSVIGFDPVYEGAMHYILPSSKGTSGSGVFNLNGEIVGQVKGGGRYYQIEQDSVVLSKYGKKALQIDGRPINQHLVPKPFIVSPDVSVTAGLATSGAPSNYIRKMVELWAPGALDAFPSVPATSASTISGQVTNIVTGAPVSGATVTVGNATATTSSDGRYSVVASSPGHESMTTGAPANGSVRTLHSQPRFSVSAVGYHTRESSLAMTGPTTVNPEIIPKGNGFDLAFFDHVFRSGGNGTTRWLTPPTFEIWTQMFHCVEPCVAGNANQQYEATADAVPAYFESRAREAVTSISDLIGGVMASPVITTKTHAVGTRVDWSAGTDKRIRFMYADKFPNAAEGGRTSLSPRPGAAMTGSHLSFNQSHSSPTEDISIYVHELAHGVGFIPGHTGNLNLVPGPSIMGPDPVAITAKDRLHAEILYKRPVGSLSPDRDPVGAVINPDIEVDLEPGSPPGALTAAAVTADQATDQPTFSVNAIPEGDSLHGVFEKYMKVFGVSILALEDYPDEMMRQVATVTAEYLDNNEDGVPDDLAVNAAIASDHGTFILVLESSAEWHAVADLPALSYIQEVTTMAAVANKGGTVCGEYCGELNNTALEHVPELIQKVGYANVYDAFANTPGSRLALALDAARGGHFLTDPAVYPEAAWYNGTAEHYSGHFVEYFFWGLVTNLGMLGDTSPGACAEFGEEWELCTKAEFQETDNLLLSILTDPTYSLPTVAPNGVYR